MRRPKIFSEMSERQYWSFKWFFLYPMAIILIGGIIMWIVLFIS